MGPSDLQASAAPEPAVRGAWAGGTPAPEWESRSLRERDWESLGTRGREAASWKRWRCDGRPRRNLEGEDGGGGPSVSRAPRQLHPLGLWASDTFSRASPACPGLPGSPCLSLLGAFLGH